MPHKPQLVTLSPTPIILGAEGAMPTRLRVLKWGANTGTKGLFVLNVAAALLIAQNQAATNFDKVALDFEHNSVKGSPTYTGEPVTVAGHGTPRVVEGDGLYLESIEWTDEGKKFVGGGHYIDLSPTVMKNGADEVTFLHSVAVCRQGALHGLHILSAESIPAQLTTNNTNNNMDAKKLLLTLLGLADTATDDEIQAACEAFATKEKAEPAMNSAITAALKPVTSTLTALSARLDDSDKRAVGAERQLILNGAHLAGKVIPKDHFEGANALTNAQLVTLVATLPQTVPLERITPLTTAITPASLLTNSADDEVRAKLGISKEKWDAAK